MPLSYSQIATYQRCPKQYEYGFVKKLPRQISAGESFGSSVHNTLKYWGERELKQRKPTIDQLALFTEEHAPPSLHQEDLIELWHQNFIVEGYESRQAADFARKRGEKLLAQFYDWWQQEPRQVVAVEKGFTIQLEQQSYTGRFDRVERMADGLHVIDFKTSAPRSQDQVDADVQLSLYALAAKDCFDEACAKLTLLFLDEDEVVERVTERTAGQLKDASRQIALLTESLQKGDYHPDPSVEKCRRCPYRNVCPAAAVRE